MKKILRFIIDWTIYFPLILIVGIPTIILCLFITAVHKVESYLEWIYDEEGI